MLAILAQKNEVSTVRTRAGVVVEGVDPQDPESIRAYYASVAAGFVGEGGFSRFIDSFGLPLSLLCSLEDLERAAFEQTVELHQTGSLHTELRGSPYSYQALIGAPVDEIIQALRAGVRRAFHERGASGSYIAAFSRQNALGEAGSPVLKRQAEGIAAAAARLHSTSEPLGIDIAGFPETAYPPRLFVEPLAPAIEAGVPITIHAGEQGVFPRFDGAPTELLWEAIDLLGVKRLGHGTSAISSLPLMQALKERGIGVECCPMSNALMGFCPLEQNPLKAFLDAGLSASISTDDPLMFGHATVAALLDDTRATLGLSPAHETALARHGVETAFVSDSRREWLAEQLESSRPEGQIGEPPGESGLKRPTW